MLVIRFITAWVAHILEFMGGCLGCCSLPAHLLSTDEPGKGLRGQHQPVRKLSILEDFWSTTSTCEMDNGTALQSQRSISSINTSNQTFDPLCGTGSTSNPTEFVNHGLLLWKQVREQWLGNKKSEKRSVKGREPRLSWNATYEGLLGTNKPFARPVPLPEMVDFLVDVWEQEGLYD